jgi:hypothetical protein
LIIFPEFPEVDSPTGNLLFANTLYQTGIYHIVL